MLQDTATIDTRKDWLVPDNSYRTWIWSLVAVVAWHGGRGYITLAAWPSSAVADIISPNFLRTLPAALHAHNTKCCRLAVAGY
jgi:hypothetical protein